MIIRTGSPIPSSNITDEKVWDARRDALRILGSGLFLSATTSVLAQTRTEAGGSATEISQRGLQPTPFRSVTQYNNYYEFSFEKEAPAELAQNLKVGPWVVEVTGEVQNPLKLDLDQLKGLYPEQEYLFRFRCVEAWAAVIPWQGFPLGELIKRANPLSSAKYVQLTAVSQPETMPNQRDHKLLNWPYTEGLRMDEAMHPLAILATGMYGKPLSKQNGAPLRLVIPWKYGFKSIKAVVRITLVSEEPKTSWNLAAPKDYGFYANVNPNVAHPRWSQSTERLLGTHLFTPRQETLLFNGYADEVGSLYAGLDLKRHF
jgi:sulfoxide reductase catalytic subunit YedY